MEILKPLAIIFGIIGLLAAIVIVGTTIEKRQAIEIYNNGIHKDCGGKWKLYSASKRINHPTVYHYNCSKCEEKFETEFGNLKTDKTDKE